MSRVRFAIGVVAFAATAAALDHPEEARKLTLLDAPGRSSLAWTAKLPPPGLPVTSPLVAGATLTVRAESGETASFDLPASGWSVDVTGTRYRFTNTLAPGGPSPVKSTTLKVQKSLMVSARSSAITLDEAAQGTVTVALAIGDDVYCSTCTTPRRDRTGRFSEKGCPAPSSCSTTTVTSTSTTSTTFVGGVCGNGVVDQPGEECDGPDPGVCAEIPPAFPIECGAPGSATACRCCGPTTCAFSALGFNIPCCGAAQCQDTSGFGQVRGGACIPPTCTQDADCNGYRCMEGACCGDAGRLCGVVGCCPGSGATCTIVSWLGAPVCCRPSGALCSALNECCSGSCTGGSCD